MLNEGPRVVTPAFIGRQPTGQRLSLPDLPEDVFVLILEELQAWDVIHCQEVSHSWRDAFKKTEYLQFVLRRYSTAIEVRSLDPCALYLNSDSSLCVNWESLFQKVASRYYNLNHGRFRKVVRYDIAPSSQVEHWFPIWSWDYHESQPGGRLYYENAIPHLTRGSQNGTKPSLFHFTLWSYDDGLLVFSPAEIMDFKQSGRPLVLLDLDTGRYSSIPFEISSKIIRSFRLKDHTLVVEWAERDPFHALNDMEQVNRHFATCFDVIRASSNDDDDSWTVKRRCEWKLHFLGLPLNQRDRFFSTHTAAHYAIYFWQPNRSMYTGDEELPIEALFVWDIRPSSTYAPSTDPAGKFQPPPHLRPHIIARFPFNDLDFLGIRQHSNISLASIHLDSRALSLTVRENTCVAGQGYFDPAERLWCATTTTFPFVGQGPHLRREWDGNLPPYRGHCTMESADVEDPEPWFVPVMDVVDEQAGVRLSLVETCFTGQSMDNRLVIRVKVQPPENKERDRVSVRNSAADWVTIADDDVVKELSTMGRIAGDERWIIGQNERMQIVVAKF